MILDELYMHRALSLAKLGLGTVSPNPMVGCVIVCDNKIIGEGFHQKHGESHAEVNSINSVADKSLLNKSTLYVTLEPCCHYGKTPPCAELIIKHKIPKVVVCNLDPNPLVAGKGIKKLQDSGIEVITNFLSDLGNELNKRFFTFFTKKRPYVILKWAQTQNGFVAKENYDSKWISNTYSRQLVHQMRAEEDAILVGYNTAFYDNPSLTVRGMPGKNPIRILIDKDLKISASSNIYNLDAKTLVFNVLKSENNQNISFIKSDGSLEFMLNSLAEKNIQSIIIEGGSATLQKFIAANLWDEAIIFESKIFFETGVKAPAIQGKICQKKHIFEDKMIIYKNI